MCFNGNWKMSTRICPLLNLSDKIHPQEQIDISCFQKAFALASLFLTKKEILFLILLWLRKCKELTLAIVVGNIIASWTTHEHCWVHPRKSWASRFFKPILVYIYFHTEYIIFTSSRQEATRYSQGDGHW